MEKIFDKIIFNELCHILTFKTILSYFLSSSKVEIKNNMLYFNAKEDADSMINMSNYNGGHNIVWETLAREIKTKLNLPFTIEKEESNKEIFNIIGRN